MLLGIKQTIKLKHTLVVFHREDIYSIVAHASMRWISLTDQPYYLTQKANYAITRLKRKSHINHQGIAWVVQ